MKMFITTATFSSSASVNTSRLFTHSTVLHIYSIFVHTDAGSSIKPELIAGVVASVALLLICLVGMLVWFVAKKRFHNQMPNVLDWTSVNPDYISGADGTLLVFLYEMVSKFAHKIHCRSTLKFKN